LNDSNILNSTERLLNTIRGETPQPAPKPSKSEKPPQQAISLKTNINHSLTAGVFIGEDSVSLVLTGERKQGEQKELIKWTHARIPEHLDINSNQFPFFLKSMLTEFLGKHKKVAIWTAIDSKHLKLRNIIIPDLHDSKIPNAALWGLKKEFEIDAQKEIFDFEFIGDTQVNGIKKKNIVAFAGDKKQISFLNQLFSTAGFPLTGITAMPFALQNFIWTALIQVDSSPIIIVNIARDYSEISCLSDKGVLLTRTIKTGAYSLVEELTGTLDKPVKESEITRILSSEIGRNSPEFQSIEQSANRLLGKLIRTGDYCSHNYAASEPVSRFLFFGETDNCQAFMEYAAEQIPSKIEKFSPFDDQSVPLLIKMPVGAQERNTIIPALGIALSEEAHTPNFLYTYLQKNINAKYKKMNLLIAAAALACLIVCIAVWGGLKSMEKNEITQKTVIENQLAQYNPIVTQALLSKTIAEAKKKSDMINRYAHDFLCLAIINEICSLTPEKIFITSLDSSFIKDDPQKEDSAKANKNERKKKRSVTIKGIVKTEFTDLESTLTGYVIRLGDSPLFGDILLEDKEIEKKAESTVLKFTADMEIL